MKPPPLLLGATLLFWGWQTGFLIPGAIMALLLEGARLVRTRWEFSNDDFARIWTFCTLIFLATTVFAFTNEGAADFRNLFQNPSLANQRHASTATARTAAALIRWLPMIFFLFVAAQVYSSREGIPLETISLILRRRWKKAQKLGQPLPPGPTVNVAYPYFVLCLFAASTHARENDFFFWGVCALLTWALWSLRSRRFSLVTWAAALLVVLELGYLGQAGVTRLQRYLDNFNAEWLANFMHRRFDPTQTKTSLGQIGRLKASGQIVIRLECPTGAPPPLLREASYQAYMAPVWTSAQAEREFDMVQHELTNDTIWVLVPGKTNAAAVRIACYLAGGKALLPLPSGSGCLENLPAYGLQKSSMGAVLAEGPGLVVFDALYGPGAGIDSPANTNADLMVPMREEAALDEIIATLGLKEQSPQQAIRTLTAFFLDKFTYSTWQELPRWRRSSQETPLTRFLLRTRSGHCEYFATSGVLLLRRLGIPTRYAVGYSVHEGSGRKYVVRQRDAHAWCLVWDQQTGLWQDVDFTPASWVETEAQRASLLQFLTDIWSRIGFEFSKFRWGQSHLRQYLLWAVVPILGFLFYQIVFRRRRRHHHAGKAAASAAVAWPGLDSEFYQLEQRLVAHGVVRQPNEPLSDWLQRALREPALAGLKDPLQALLRLHYRYRFDPQGISQPEREQLQREAAACVEKIRRGQGQPG